MPRHSWLHRNELFPSVDCSDTSRECLRLLAVTHRSFVRIPVESGRVFGLALGQDSRGEDKERTDKTYHIVN